jgi:pyruvate dehydrogenase E1 component beta subunit
MAIITYIEALNQALKEEMQRDERVVIWGEDLISMNGVFGQTKDIYDEFGGDRIKDTPICEQAIAGMAMGAAYRGLRPIGVFMNAGFSLCAFDTVFLKLGCIAGSLGGGSSNTGVHGYRISMPVVLYGVVGGQRDDNDHGMSPEALYMHAPYLKIVMPSTPYDVKGLMKTAIRDDYPVIFADHTWCFFMGHKDGEIIRSREAGSQEVPEKEYLIPFGKADIKRQGSDVTLVTYSFMVHVALAAAYNLAKEGISVEIVDVRTIVPLDVEAIIASAKKTGRLLIVHEAMKRGGSAGEILWRVHEEAPDLVRSLKSFKRLAAKNLPMNTHYGPRLVPSVDTVTDTVKGMMNT